MSESQPKRKIVFHIGLEKTATTSFQKFCFDHREALRRQGILYPGSRHVVDSIARRHGPFVGGYLSKGSNPDYALSKTWGNRRQVVDALKREIDQSNCGTIVISSEHLSSRFREQQIAWLAEDFREFECEVVLVIRNHEDMVASAYYTTVMAGRSLSLGDYLSELTHGDNNYIRFSKIVSMWDAAFGKDQILLLNYRPNGTVKMLQEALLPASVQSHGAENYDNITGDARVLHAMRLYNQLIAERFHFDPTDYTAFAVKALARGQLRRRLFRMTQSEQRTRLILPPDCLKKLQPIIELDREWLARNHGFELPVWQKRVETEAVDPEEGGRKLLSLSGIERGVWFRILRLLDHDWIGRFKRKTGL